MKYITLLLVLVIASCKTDNGFVKAVHIPSKLDSLDEVGIERLVQVPIQTFMIFSLGLIHNITHNIPGREIVL